MEVSEAKTYHPLEINQYPYMVQNKVFLYQLSSVGFDGRIRFITNNIILININMRNLNYHIYNAWYTK